VCGSLEEGLEETDRIAENSGRGGWELFDRGWELFINRRMGGREKAFLGVL
jgi:hypothetical protein